MSDESIDLAVGLGFIVLLVAAVLGLLMLAHDADEDPDERCLAPYMVHIHEDGRWRLRHLCLPEELISREDSHGIEG